MKKNGISEKIHNILRRDQRFAFDAYIFVNSAVNYTSKQLKEKQHVSAAELLDGVRRFSDDQFGPFAEDVLRQWGISRARDIGSIVFNLIEENVLKASKDDSLQDFSLDFDLFETAREKRQPAGNLKNVKVPIIA